MSAAPPIIRAGPVAVPLDYPVPVSSEIVPVAISATFSDPTNAGPYVPALVILTPDGHQLGPYPLGASIAAGASARVSWFPGGELEEAAAGFVAGVTIEVLYVDSTSAAPVAASSTLLSGVTYSVVVEGTWSDWNDPLVFGSPEADAMFPGSTAGRVSTQVGLDAETIFALPNPGPPPPIGHYTQFQISLDGGATFSHLEPVGGPFGVPQVGHLYRYELVGQGHPPQFSVLDTPTTDNYGKLRITLQVPSGTGTGSGAGSLVPPADSTMNAQLLQVSGGVPAFGSLDGGSP